MSMARFLRLFRKCTRENRLEFNAVKVEKVGFFGRKKVTTIIDGKVTKTEYIMPAQSKPAAHEPKAETAPKHAGPETKPHAAEPKAKTAAPEPKSKPAAPEPKPKLKLMSVFNIIVGAQLLADKAGKIFSGWLDRF